MSDVQEQTFLENGFGTVTNKRVIYYREKGWFSGGSREDIPLKHVTSVRVDISRNIIFGMILIAVSMWLILQNTGVAFWGFIMFAFGLLLLWGSPCVVVNTAGNDKNKSKGLPWHRDDANKFVENLRSQIFRE